MSRAGVGQRCRRCGYAFRVLEDEQGMHPCPRCGPEHEQDAMRELDDERDPEDCP
jgi:predicted Zn-ribbon and HTH transcriptional regulator